jgi:hypothetical protein
MSPRVNSLHLPRISDYSAELGGQRTASIKRSNSQVYSEAPRGRRTASMERRARGYSQEPRGPSDSMERKAQDYSDEPRLPREDSASSIERLAREFSGDLHGVEEPAKEKDQGRDQSAERRRQEASVKANGRSTSVERCEREASVEHTRPANVAAYWHIKVHSPIMIKYRCFLKTHSLQRTLLRILLLRKKHPRANFSVYIIVSPPLTLRFTALHITDESRRGRGRLVPLLCQIRGSLGGEEAGSFPLHSLRRRSVKASEEAGSFRAREEAGSFSRKLVGGIEEAGSFGRRWRRVLVRKEKEAGSFPSSRLL